MRIGQIVWWIAQSTGMGKEVIAGRVVSFDEQTVCLSCGAFEKVIFLGKEEIFDDRTLVRAKMASHILEEQIRVKEMVEREVVT